jgi:hypothetical protein
MSLTKLSLGGNNDVIYKLFPSREILVSDILARDGNIEKLFYGVSRPVFSCLLVTFPVFLSFLSTPPVSPTRNVIPYPTDLISDNLQCLNDGDVSQLLGNAQGRLSILQKKDKKYGENFGNMSRSPGLGIRILLIQK